MNCVLANVKYRRAASVLRDKCSCYSNFDDFEAVAKATKSQKEYLCESIQPSRCGQIKITKCAGVKTPGLGKSNSCNIYT